jgi:hypothetical protein
VIVLGVAAVGVRCQPASRGVFGFDDFHARAGVVRAASLVAWRGLPCNPLIDDSVSWPCLKLTRTLS